MKQLQHDASMLKAKIKYSTLAWLAKTIANAQEQFQKDEKYQIQTEIMVLINS